MRRRTKKANRLERLVQFVLTHQFHIPKRTLAEGGFIGRS